MYNLDDTFDLSKIYFYVNKTKGYSRPLLINEDATCLECLYCGEKFESTKEFPFKVTPNANISVTNFSFVAKINDEILIHRLWWLLEYTKYFKNTSLINKLKIKHLNKKNIATLADIIEINDIINHSSKLKREFKKEQKNQNEKTL